MNITFDEIAFGIDFIDAIDELERGEFSQTVKLDRGLNDFETTLINQNHNSYQVSEKSGKAEITKIR